jgi:hypothetical protein
MCAPYKILELPSRKKLQKSGATSITLCIKSHILFFLVKTRNHPVYIGIILLCQYKLDIIHTLHYTLSGLPETRNKINNLQKNTKELNTINELDMFQNLVELLPNFL